MFSKGLFINNIRAQDSIYESGMMVYNCLKLSTEYQLDYIEVSDDKRWISSEYDFYYFNYHPTTMYWLDTSKLKKWGKVMITMVLEVAPDDPFVLCPSGHFDGYCVLDPTIRSKRKRVFPFPRPLEKATPIQIYKNSEIPIIGSFGFATKGKGFQHVIEAINKEFEKAIVKINIPFGDFVPDSREYATYLADICRKKAKEGVEVVITHDYMSKPDLINWCASNTLNCFLYDRDIPGLSATTDQAIVAGRPLAISNNNTFRHILEYIPAYPEQSLLQSIEFSQSAVLKMKENWSQENFCKKFEAILPEIMGERKKNKVVVTQRKMELPVIKHTFYTQLERYSQKVLRLFRKGGLKKISLLRNFFADEELI